ncbi:MAG: zinc-dependent alcohol dehydrogenase family protein [Syntrophales bacterium]|nr:zinc-dependent alcohol dehydrogenase family protein [Syntrophales bacterium]
MKALVIDAIKDLGTGAAPLAAMEMPEPTPGGGEIVLQVTACGVCHTELDEIEGRTAPPHLPIIPGHQVVGRVVARGPGAERFQEGERVGVAWIYAACGVCSLCLSGNENLCPSFTATGRDRHGGYAPFMAVPEAFAYPLPAILGDTEVAPLLCAGAIGYRSLKLTGIGNGCILGLTGFGASAHIVLKLVRHLYPQTEVFVFARSEEERRFAASLGAAWTGDTTTPPPASMDAVIDTTPAWLPVVKALEGLRPGGRLVINAIRKEDKDRHYLATLDYPIHLWMEKEVKSVANVTRDDVAQMLALAATIPIRPEIQLYPFAEANRALMDLKERRIRGAKVLVFP